MVVEWTAGDRCDSTASPPSLKRRSSFPVVELAVGRVRGRPDIVAVKRRARDISLSRPSASVSNHSSPSHFIPLTPPSNHPRQPLITTRSACRRPRSTHPTQHCTGDTDLTTQSAGPCSAIRQRALTADICENRLLTDAFTGSTAGQLSETPSQHLILLCDCGPIPHRLHLRAKVSACLW